MQHGTREPFQYGECFSCKSLQILVIPDNLGAYYPRDYYAFHPASPRRTRSGLHRRLFTSWLLGSTSALAERLARYKEREYPFFRWAQLSGCSSNSAIADVGCGAGGLLRRMQRHGFTHLTGVDPYATLDVSEPGFQLRQAELKDVGGPFDLLMLHHVLEHFEDPFSALVEAKKHLSASGAVLVRIPLAASDSFRTYRHHWYNLDPPRHITVPSMEGMRRLAARAGYRIVHAYCDGIEVGYLYSEYYARDIPFTQRPKPDPERVRHFRALATSANIRGEGDQGVFLLRPS